MGKKQQSKITALYRNAGFKPPKGKGIHTMKFHRCVVDVMKKIRAGDLPKGSSPHAICMESLGKETAVHQAHQRAEEMRRQLA